MFLAVFTLILSDDKNRFFQSTVENSLNDWERLQRNNGGMVSIGACVEKRLGKKNRSTDKLLPSHQNLIENFSKEDSKILAFVRYGVWAVLLSIELISTKVVSAHVAIYVHFEVRSYIFSAWINRDSKFSRIFIIFYNIHAIFFFLFLCVIRAISFFFYVSSYWFLFLW